ncbi:MAG: DUF2849 domain-containing protein [Rhodospirillaceae bacterium]
MARSGDGPKVISANRLDTGAVVWLGAGDSWVEPLSAASVFEGDEVAAALVRAKAAERANRIVDANPVEIELVDGRPEPVRARERIRAKGPSVRADLGYQAGQFS